MTEAKHTPGPWCKSGVIVKGANGEAVCFLSQRNDDRRKPDEELKANGNLIVAAPKLLEACEAYYYGRVETSEAERMMAIAIAEAREVTP